MQRNGEDMASHGDDDEHIDAADLAALMDGLLEPADAALVHAHLEGCPACRGELVETGRVLDAWAENDQAAARPSARLVRRSQWHRAAGAAGVLMAASLAGLLLLRDPAAPGVQPTLRTNPPPSAEALPDITVISPADGAVVARPIRFAWQPTGAVQYRLRLTDAAGEILWMQDSPDTVAVLPATVTLEAGGTYFWHVDGVTDGVTSTTRTRRFVVSP